jgi:Family of unknown function (DUF6527)
MAAKVHFAGSFTDNAQGVQSVYMFHCPGCGRGHGYHVPHWDFNGDLEKPTFTPSLLCDKDNPKKSVIYLLRTVKSFINKTVIISWQARL